MFIEWQGYQIITDIHEIGKGKNQNKWTFSYIAVGDKHSLDYYEQYYDPETRLYDCEETVRKAVIKLARSLVKPIEGSG